jgi:NlpC/P60 family
MDLSSLTLLDDPGIGGNASIAKVAVQHYGEFYRPDGVPWVGWCEMFVGDVLAQAGFSHPRFDTAMLDAISAPLYRGAAPAGSLVFFDQRASPYGHVGISLGDGTMLSALGGGIVRTSYYWVSYVGWRPYGATTAPATESFTVTPLLFVPLPEEAVTEPVVLMPSFDDQPSWYMPPPYRTQDDVRK